LMNCTDKGPIPELDELYRKRTYTRAWWTVQTKDLYQSLMNCTDTVNNPLIW